MEHGIVGAMQMSSKLLELTNRQDGLVTRQQALEHGLTAAAIRHALDKEKCWRRVVWGIYATFTSTLLDRHRIRAALLYAGDEAMLSGSHACRGYGMEYVSDAAVPLILVPSHIKRAKIDIARIRRVQEIPAPRTVHGVPCAPPERAALDAVRKAASLRQARATLCEVVQRRLVTVERLIDELSRVDLRGMRYAQAALANVQAGCRSAPECELRDLMLTSELIPAVTWNQPLPDADDLVPDAYIVEARLVLEVESIEWHQFGEAPEMTERRRARYASLGWRVLPLSPRRIRDDSEMVLAEIEAAVLAGLRRAA